MLSLPRGKRCVEPGERILTETEGPVGPMVDIRTKEEAWHYDSAHPAVLHLQPR
jgi:hypothetical protein